MRQSLKIWLSFALFVIMVTVAWSFFAPSEDYQNLACERHELTYDGQPVIGVEDMAYDEQSGQIYLSAYDRRGGNSGGIYMLNKNNNLDRLPLPSTDPQAYWPHGFYLSHQDNQADLNVIERDLRVKGQQKARISQYSWNTAKPNDIQLVRRIEDDLLCAANDLTFVPSGFNHESAYYITRDHETCGLWRQKWDNVFRPKSSSLLRMRQDAEAKPTVIIKKLSYANGVAPHPYGGLYIGETRAQRLSQQFGTFKTPPHHSQGNVTLPGGPDNLTVTEQGDILAALHPNLIRFAAFRAGWGSRVKSRFAIIAPDKSVNTYDVPADIMSGATVALKVDKSVYLGGAFDNGIAVCSLPGAPNE